MTKHANLLSDFLRLLYLQKKVNSTFYCLKSLSFMNNFILVIELNYCIYVKKKLAIHNCSKEKIMGCQ